MPLLNSQSQKALIARYIAEDSLSSANDEKTRGTRDAKDNDTEDDNTGQVSQPSYEDATILELQFIEEQFLAYSQSPFNIAELQFNSKECPKSLLSDESHTPDLDTLLGYLPLVLPATKQFSYRARGYTRLITTLQHMDLPSTELVAHRSDLIAIISAELACLLSAATEELRMQATMGTHEDGSRRIHFAAPNSGRRTSPIVLATIVLVAIVHCMMGVARDHCNLLLKCFQCILQLAANMQGTQATIFTTNHIKPIPITLPTALHYLGLQDNLDLYVVCPSCDSLYKIGAESCPPDQCIDRDIDGKLCGALLFTHQHRGNSTWKKPIRRFSHQPLESWLCRFLSRPGIEDMLESARPVNESLCTDIWGGPYLSNFSVDGKTRFFECPADELRLAFLVYYDHFNPFTLKISGKKRSSGLLMMVCLNLPPEIRYDLKNIYVAAMLPGPKEPTLENINKFMRPIVDNLHEHYLSAVHISKTYKHAKGRKVRSVVPVSSMDIMASRPFAGIGGPSHNIFCSFCNASLSEIDNFNVSSFDERSLAEYLVGLNHWDAAKSSADRELVWKDHAVRRSEWSRFPWYDPFKGTIIAPLHWTKNVLEKQIRENMGCSAVLHHGITEPPPLSRPITAVEANWGYQAMIYSSEEDFQKSNMPEPLLRFICRKQNIYEAGLPSKRLIEELSAFRRRHGIVNADGSASNPEQNISVSIAKTEYYLSKVDESLSILEANSTMASLRGLSSKFMILWASEDKKAVLMKRLVEHYKTVTIVVLAETVRSKNDVRLLGLEIVAAIKDDMQRTCIPGWIKKPPINFATIDHGKLASEEYKSLALVSLPITLIRLWGTGNSTLRERLDNFLHLSIAVRILSYQSLTENDIAYFEYHYQQYVNELKQLYPFCTITPVQHLGLHIPYFMRTLGPTTRYSENTCEMFIGMLEDISTNHRIGELEQTLHRELIMAANLKAMTERWNFSDILEPYADLIGDFLQNRYPGSERPSSAGWYTKHKGDPMMVDPDTHAALSSWAELNGIPPFTRRLHVCEQLRRGNVAYQPFKDSRGNSCISFRPRGIIAPVPGRIEAILQEPKEAIATQDPPRIIVLARTFIPLTDEDAANDPYRNHPIVGTSRFGIMRIFYDAVDTNRVHIIEPDDIVSHIAVCGFFDPHGIISAPCSVVVDLDMKHTFDP